MTPGGGRGSDRIGILDTGFRTALARLDQAGLLARVSRTVDPDLEVAGLMKRHDAGA
ncbi:MAG: UbiD family decarboxylase, partial [Acidimicrobiaceae bacterium]|nr:UbiD family decarboxylase [Acidimicrobiaceae bacterium]